MVTKRTTDDVRNLSDREETRISELASFLAASSVEVVSRLCERVAEDEVTFARLANAVRALSRRSTSHGDPETFLVRTHRLDGRGETDTALDLIYDGFDELFRGDQMETADGLLRDVDAAALSDALLVGILTATLPAKSKLSARASFYAEAERLLTERGSMEPGLLAGLEP